MSNLLEQASLVLIPSGYKEDVVYSEIPINGAGDMSFTRASNGTRINSQGLVETVPWNLVTYSEQFQNADWFGGGNGKPTMTDNFAEAPNGTMTASKMESATDGYQLRQNNAQENTQMNLSVWLRTNTGTKTIQLFLNNANTASQNITVTTTWTRYEVSGLVTTLSGSGRNGLNTLEALTSGAYILVWGFQLSVGLTAKPYFPTTDRLNVPRLTYQNGGGGCPSLLLEKQSTNLQYYSQQFDLWSNASDLTVSANATTSPDGTQNADKLNENSSNGYHITGDSNFSSTAGTTYTMSFFAKASERSYARILAPASSYNTDYAYFDLTNGSVSVSSGTASMQSMGNGWYRCVWSLAAVSTSGGIGMWIGPARNMTDAYNTYTGTSGSGIFVYGAQLEASSYATSYIPTTSSSATRVADLSTSDTIQTAQTFAGDFTFFVDFVSFTTTDALGPTNQMIIGGGNQSLGATYKSYFWITQGSIQLTGDSETSIIVATKTFTANQRYKLLVKRNGTTVKIFCDGVQVGSSATSSLSITIRSIGWSYSNNYRFNGLINQVVLSATGFSDADCQSLTTI